MSIAEKFISKKIDPLASIRIAITETLGIIPTGNHLKNKSNRKNLHKMYPNRFLTSDKYGSPSFPIKNEFGAVCPKIIKKSLNSANSKLTHTGDTKYMKIIERLQSELQQIKTKVMTTPSMYEPLDDKLYNVVHRFKNTKVSI